MTHRSFARCPAVAALSLIAWLHGCAEDPGSPDRSLEPDAGRGAAASSEPRCGNRVLELGEECDGAELGGIRCQGASGPLQPVPACTRDCRLDFDACPEIEPPPEARCGNGIVEEGEECDTVVEEALTCERLGFEGGVLACGRDCRLDTDGCDRPDACAPAECPDICEGDTLVSGRTQRADCRCGGGRRTACARGCGGSPPGCTGAPPCEGRECPSQCEGDARIVRTCEAETGRCVEVDRSNCAFGCADDGDCQEDPCADVDCRDDICEGTTAVVGRTCSNGLCVGGRRVACDRCVAGACACVPEPARYCRDGSVFERDGCGADGLVERCDNGCANGTCRECVARPERYCSDSDLRERDGCGDDDLVQRCDHGCANGACRPCLPSPERYCSGSELRERDGCGDDGLVERCPHGCANGACRPCPPSPERYCSGSELRERDGCGDDRLVQRCADGCANNACRVCDEVLACSAGRRMPGDGNPENPVGEVMSLRVVSTADCDRLSLEVSKADGSNIGNGDYTVRVGTCRSFGAVRGSFSIPSAEIPRPTPRIGFTVPFRGGDGDEKLFCVTRSDGPHAVWWWSNIAIVDGALERSCR